MVGRKDHSITLVLVALSWLAIAPDSEAGGQWSTLAPMNEPRQEIAVAALAGKVYAAGGFRGDLSTADTVEVYDPVGNQWDFAAPLPVAVHHPAAAAVDGTLYVIGGLVGASPRNTVFAYDPVAGEWSPRSPMPTARGGLAVAVIGGKIYAAGGQPEPRERDFAVYDPVADQWTVLPVMPSPRNHLAAGAMRGRFYAVGGRSGGIDGITGALEEYNPATNAWRVRTALPTPRGGIGAAVVHNCLYVFGGEGNEDEPTGVFEENEGYDVRSGVWALEAPMPTPRHGIGAAVIDGRIYIPGGATLQGFGVTGVNEAFEPDRFCDFTVSPSSGTFVSRQTLDITLISETAASIDSVTALLDGVNISNAFSGCAVAGSLGLGGETLRCRVPGTLFAGRVRTLAVTVDLSDGSQRTDTVTWDVLQSSEP